MSGAAGVSLRKSNLYITHYREWVNTLLYRLAFHRQENKWEQRSLTGPLTRQHPGTAALSPVSHPGGNPRPVHVGSVVNKLAMAHFFRWVHQLPPFNIFQPKSHTHSFAIKTSNFSVGLKARQHKGLVHTLSQQLSALLNNTLKKPQTMVDKVFLS